MKRSVLFMVFIFLSASGSGRDFDRKVLRYNEVQQKASHNSYQRGEDLITQLGDFNIRTIELDIHSKPNAPYGDFLVYHTLRDNYTNCVLLSQCFSKVMEFHKANPAHDVITIFFDVDGLDVKGHTKKEFYNLIERTLTKDAIVKPADLMSACPSARTLQESVTIKGCGWPKLEDIRGKFVLVISDGRKYFEEQGYDIRADLVFLASKSSNPKKMHSNPNWIFFNLSGPDEFVKKVKSAGFVSRCYWLDTKEKYEKAMALGANILATDNIDPEEFPYTNTTQEDNFPFKVIK